MEARDYIKQIVLEGTPEQKRALFAFNSQTPDEKVLKKFKIFSRALFNRYFSEKEAPFHDEMILRTIKSYRGTNVADIAYRGSAKTTLKKLVRVYLLLNDEDHFRKYIKILCRDLMNSKQIVTDIYNLCLECSSIYGDIFQKEGEKKVEETMLAFNLAWGVKVTASTVGQKQRGHLQDAYRPDWLWFEDIEDVESVSSEVITQGVIVRSDEAITGLARNGSWELTGNYISDTGSVQWFLNKKNIVISIIPIANDMIVDGKKIVSCVPTWQIYTLTSIQALMDDALDFWGDYMCDPNRSENKFFDIEMVEGDIRIAQQMAPLRISGSGVRYWRNYNMGHRYGMGSDHSEGIGQDSNTLAVFDFTVGEIVATYANNEVPPDLATQEFAKVGGEYSSPVWLPEVNNKCGGIVLTTALDLKYPRLYKQKMIKDGQEIESNKVGWETNSKTKNTMFFEFRRDYNDGLILINDIEILKEMKAYTNNDLKEKTTGLITRHFDLLTACVIAWQGRGEFDPQVSRTATVQHHDV